MENVVSRQCIIDTPTGQRKTRRDETGIARGVQIAKNAVPINPQLRLLMMGEGKERLVAWIVSTPGATTAITSTREVRLPFMRVTNPTANGSARDQLHVRMRS